MFSKWFFLLVVSFPFISNCAKEDKPKSPVIYVKGSCDLKNIGSDLQKFTKGELSDEQVVGVWSCAAQAVNDFDRITKGDLPGGDYSAQAVRDFFKKYFLSNRKVDDKLLASVMRLKQVVVSGSVDRITHQELSRLRDLVQLVRELSVAMNPYAKVIFLNADSASDEEILSANQAFDLSIRRIGEWMGVQNQSYTFAEAKDLIHGLRQWLSQEASQPQALEDFEKVFDVIPSLKQILLSGNKDGLSGADWAPLAQALGQTHCALLAIKYSFKEDFIAGLNRGAIPRGLEKLIATLDESRRLHASQEIPLSEWSEFFQKIEDTGWLSKNFNRKNLDQALSWVVNRLLNGTDGSTETAIKEIHLRTLRKNLGRWMGLRNYILAGQMRDPSSEIETQFEEILAASYPAEWDARGRQVFQVHVPGAWSTAAKLNMIWPFVVVNWIKESFVGENPVNMDEGQMLIAGQEILSVLRAFGWLQKSKDTIGKKLLREADLFTAASNGDSLIDLKEATRYLAFVASAFRAAQEWKEQAKSICADQNAICLRKAAVDSKLDILSPLPHLTAGFKKPVKEFEKYSKAAEETILGQPATDTMGTGDLLQVWMVFQYVETFEHRFDVDPNDDIINLREGKEAFQLFGGPLGKMVEPIGLPPNEVLGFFTFLLKYGDTPFTMLGGQIAYNHWKWHENDWTLETDRQKLIEVLKQLSKL
jgi:hypothetical protein